MEWKEGRIRGGGGDISLFPLCWLSQTCVRNTPAKEVRYDLRWHHKSVMRNLLAMSSETDLHRSGSRICLEARNRVGHRETH